MFLLFATIPHYLNALGSNHNLTPEQQNLFAIESFLSAKILGKENEYDIDPEVEGIQTHPNLDASIEELTHSLQRAKQKSILSGTSGNLDGLVDVLGEFALGRTSAEQRIRDLEGILSLIEFDPASFPYGYREEFYQELEKTYGTQDVNVISSEVSEALKPVKEFYKFVLREERYWGEIIRSRIKYENSLPTVKGDISKKEMMRDQAIDTDQVIRKDARGLRAFVLLEEAIYALIEERDLDQETTSNLRTAFPDINPLDASQIRTKMLGVAAHLFANINKARDESWFSDFQDAVRNTMNKNEVEFKKDIERRNQLEALLHAMIKGDEEKVKEISPQLKEVYKDRFPYWDLSDTNTIRQEMYRMAANAGEIVSSNYMLKRLVAPDEKYFAPDVNAAHMKHENELQEVEKTLQAKIEVNKNNPANKGLQDELLRALALKSELRNSINFWHKTDSAAKDGVIPEGYPYYAYTHLMRSYRPDFWDSFYSRSIENTDEQIKIFEDISKANPTFVPPRNIESLKVHRDRLIAEHKFWEEVSN